MTKFSIGKYKIVLAAVMILLLFFIVLAYRVVKRNAEVYVQELVETQSAGKLQFQVEKVKFDLLELTLEFRNPELRTHDTISTETGYHIMARSLSVKIQALLPLLTKKHVVIDSVVVQSPEIEVNRYQKGPRDHITVPEEMNVIYLSLKKVLAFINLDYLRIADAKFILNDFTKSGSVPIVLSRMNLVVESVNDANGTGDERFLLADQIMFEIFNQDIASPDGLSRLKFKKLRLSTGSKSLKLDSCYISVASSGSTGAGFNTFVDTLRISNIDFNALVKESKIKVDSALCINPDLSFLIRSKVVASHRRSLHEVVEKSDSLDFMLKKMLGNLDIGYLAVKNAKVKILAQKGDKSKVFQTDSTNFTLRNFLVSRDPAIPIHLERFNLHLMNYKSYSSDSLYVVSFDDIQVINKGISLLNFSIAPTSENHDLLSREIKMAAFEFNAIDWPRLLYESRIVAGSAVLLRPEMHFRLPEKKHRSPGGTLNPLRLLNQLKDKIQVGGLFVRDGLFTLDILNGKHFAIDHLNAAVKVNRLLQVENSIGILNALDTLSFRNGEFHSPELALGLTEGRYSSRFQSVKLNGIIHAKTDKSLEVKLKGVALDGIHIDSLESIRIQSFKWDTAEVSVNSFQKQAKVVSNSPPANRMITIGGISGGNSSFAIQSNGMNAVAKLHQITSDQLVLANGSRPSIAGLYLEGEYIHLKKGELRGDLGPFVFQDQKLSTLNDLLINLPIAEETAFIHLPKVTFSADLAKIVAGELSLERMDLQKPVVSFLPKTRKVETLAVPNAPKIPTLKIGRLKISQPRLIGLPKELAGKMRLDPGFSEWNLVGIVTDTAFVSVDSLKFSTDRPYFNNPTFSLQPTGREKVMLRASSLQFRPKTAVLKSNWSLVLDTANTSGFDIQLQDSGLVKQHIVLDNLGLSHLRLDNSTVANLPELFKSNPDFSVSGGDLFYENDKILLSALNLSFDKVNKSVAFDSLSYSPRADRAEFMKGREFRQSYIQLNTGSLQFRNLDFDQLLSDTVFHAGKLMVNNLKFLNYMDKRLPFQHGIEKPMLTELFTKIKVKFVLDSLLLKNAEIQAQEINDKTLLPATIDFTRIRGVISGIRNCNYSIDDSLSLNLYARFLGATDLRVNYEQAYADTLSGFELKAIASSFDMTALNPMLQPIASARVKSGYLDTLRMSVVGRKHVAFGVMKMHYRNLNVQYLNQGVAENATTRTKLISFFANRIVRRQRLMGSGDVYAERDPEKGFVNYWVKIFIGGVLTNTGVKSDKKQEKKYASSIQKYKVPPIPDIPVDY